MSAPRIATGSIVAGKYSVGTCLGYGGSAATYHAAAVGGREVAVKIFDPALRQRPEAMAQLEKVYAATNGLPHDSTLPILDAGYDPATGSAFSVTERVPHPSVAQFIAQRTMTPEEAAAMLVSVARALDAAHQRKLCHHALKPTNVFVRTTDLGGIVADFGAGIVRTAAPSAEGYALSAPWLSPEQAQTAQPGIPADVFALTLLAFYALTGRSYWLACQGAQPDFAGWQREILSPRTPASARAQQLGVSLSAAFDAPLARGLAIDPRERFPTASDLARAIDGVVRGHAGDVHARGPDSATQAFPVSHLMPEPAQAAAMFAAPMQQAPMQQAPMAPQQPMGAVAGVPIAPGSYSGTVNANALDTTGLQPVEPNGARASATTKLAPVFVGAVVVLLLGGAVASYVALGRPKPAVVAATSASAGVASTAPSLPSAAPSSTAAATDATASAAPSAEASAPTGKLALSCDPSCDAIGVDDQPLTDPVAMDLTPGKHKISLGKDGYASQTDTITVEVGKTFTKKYKLAKAVEATATPPSNPNPTPKPPSNPPSNGKKCGKFLDRCK